MTFMIRCINSITILVLFLPSVAATAPTAGGCRPASAERAGAEAGLSGADARAGAEVQRRVRRRDRSPRACRIRGAWRSCRTARCSSPRSSRAGCASSAPTASSPSRWPDCRRWTRAARAACSTSRSIPAFATNQLIYWSYSEPREDGIEQHRRRARHVRATAPRRASTTCR